MSESTEPVNTFSVTAETESPEFATAVQRIAVPAARDGDLQTLKSFLETEWKQQNTTRGFKAYPQQHHIEHFVTQVVTTAAEHDKIDVLRWLKEKEYAKHLSSDAALKSARAIANSHTETQPCDTTLFQWAVKQIDSRVVSDKHKNTIMGYIKANQLSDALELFEQLTKPEIKLLDATIENRSTSGSAVSPTVNLTTPQPQAQPPAMPKVPTKLHHDFIDLCGNSAWSDAQTNAGITSPLTTENMPNKEASLAKALLTNLALIRLKHNGLPASLASLNVEALETQASSLLKPPLIKPTTQPTPQPRATTTTQQLDCSQNTLTTLEQLLGTLKKHREKIQAEANSTPTILSPAQNKLTTAKVQAIDNIVSQVNSALKSGNSAAISTAWQRLADERETLKTRRITWNNCDKQSSWWEAGRGLFGGRGLTTSASIAQQIDSVVKGLHQDAIPSPSQ